MQEWIFLISQGRVSLHGFFTGLSYKAKRRSPKTPSLYLCKDSFVNTMNTKMSITVHNDGRLVFTFTNGSEETVMM